MTLEELRARAAELAGREVSAVKTSDGKVIALWLSFDSPPPPKGDTEEEALQGFIDMMLKRRDAAVTIVSDDTASGETAHGNQT